MKNDLLQQTRRIGVPPVSPFRIEPNQTHPGPLALINLSVRYRFDLAAEGLGVSGLYWGYDEQDEEAEKFEKGDEVQGCCAGPEMGRSDRGHISGGGSN